MKPKDVMEMRRIMLKSGAKEKDIAAAFGLTTMELRALNMYYLKAERLADTGNARILYKEGKTCSEIATILGKTESYTRWLLDDKKDKNSPISYEKVEKDLESLGLTVGVEVPVQKAE